MTEFDVKLPSTALIAAAAAAALTLAACGDDAEMIEDATSDEATEAPDDADDRDDAAGAGTVSIVDNAVDPDGIDVAEGDTVEWVHEGEIPHNVTVDDEASDSLSTGDSYRRTFGEDGELAYSCTFHPGMDGTVTVG